MGFQVQREALMAEGGGGALDWLCFCVCFLFCFVVSRYKLLVGKLGDASHPIGLISGAAVHLCVFGV